jgi:hypothetical protein
MQSLKMGGAAVHLSPGLPTGGYNNFTRYAGSPWC